MRIGVLLLPTDPWPETVARVRQLEAMGYDHIWTYDHLSWRRYRDRPWHAAVPWLTGVAAVTSRIRVGTLVSSPNFRHPVTLAKEAMTLDHVSGGRLTLGVGAGGTGFDATVLGGQVQPPVVRAARLAEFVEALGGLLREPAAYSYEGDFYTVDDARTLPGCVQLPRLPLAIAAGGRRTLRTVARHADAWITEGEAAAVREQVAVLEDACARIGRDPAQLDRIHLAGDEERALGSVQAFTDHAGRYAELGFTDLVFHHPRRDDPVWTDDPAVVEQIASEVLPGLRFGDEDGGHAGELQDTQHVAGGVDRDKAATLGDCGPATGHEGAQRRRVDEGGGR
jgi:alkanesulfonate monooxygenase SsuD/methylene tetrahydromethanopterin reductase-like flavin-dependent oxidoreductase (luciferase family)